ncbi:exosortase A [Azoarcus sp. L1K30]|uniref:exosortase A n=1 Tax=Azoarcus sp. L1K30 TaxID=2820277 RepID=UPI001B80FD5C|nr:exosortase A [Azoarcus sp. L1K30]MBR0568568.1 exosortase A [Azoarcus sp. L1K30]
MSTHEYANADTSGTFVVSEPGGPFRRVVFVLLVVFAWCVGWYWSTAAEIASLWWMSETFAHGLVVLPVFGWLVWRLRERIALLPPLPEIRFIGVVLLGGLLWIAGDAAAVSAATHAGLGIMLLGSIASLLGTQLTVALAFPLVFLLFGVPIGDFLLPEMMDLTARFTVSALRLSGVPVYQEGLQFIVPNGRWSVVEACSGIRYLIASIFVGSLYAYLSYRSARKRLLFMCAALVVPILANWVRAYLIVMLGYLSGNKLATGVDHLIYGWVFFGVVILLLFASGRRWMDEPADLSAPIKPANPQQKARWSVALPLALVLAAFPLAAHRISPPSAQFEVAYTPPVAASNWMIVAGATPEYRPSYVGYRGMAESVYASRTLAQPPVFLFSALYAEQGQGAEMVTFGNGLRPEGGTGAKTIPSEALETALGTVDYVLINTAGRFSVIRWYVVNGRVMTREWEVKARLALMRLLGQSDTSMVFVLSTPDTDESGVDRLRAFIADHAESIRAATMRAQGEGRR